MSQIKIIQLCLTSIFYIVIFKLFLIFLLKMYQILEVFIIFLIFFDKRKKKFILFYLLRYFK